MLLKKIYISKTTVRVGGTEVPRSRIGFVRIMIISYVIRYSTSSGTHKQVKVSKSTFKKKTSKLVLYAQCLKVPETTSFKKRFPKLSYKGSVNYNDS